MPVEEVAHPRLKGLRRGLGREPEVEPDLQRAGNDVAGTRPRMDVGDLETRRLEVLVAAIPLGRNERAQHGRSGVNRVAAPFGIRDVTLQALYAEASVQ